MSFDNPTFTGDLNQPDDGPTRSTPGPVPLWAGAIVIAAIFGQAILRKAFKNA